MAKVNLDDSAAVAGACARHASALDAYRSQHPTIAHTASSAPVIDNQAYHKVTDASSLAALVHAAYAIHTHRAALALPPTASHLLVTLSVLQHPKALDAQPVTARINFVELSGPMPSALVNVLQQLARPGGVVDGAAYQASKLTHVLQV